MSAAAPSAQEASLAECRWELPRVLLNYQLLLYRVPLQADSWLQVASSCPELQHLRGGRAGRSADSAVADALPSIAPRLAVRLNADRGAQPHLTCGVPGAWWHQAAWPAWCRQAAGRANIATRLAPWALWAFSTSAEWTGLSITRERAPAWLLYLPA